MSHRAASSIDDDDDELDSAEIDSENPVGDRMPLVLGRAEMLPESLLWINPAYQRWVSERHVNDIATNFDPNVFGALIVSHRDDGGGDRYAVVDGQHRLLALRLVAPSDIAAPCSIRDGLSVEDEASIFWKMNKTRLQVSGSAEFKARLIAREPIALGINEIATKYGVYMQQKGPGPLGLREVGAFSSVEEIYIAGHLDRVFRIMTEGWGQERGVLRAKYIRGIYRFLVERNHAHLIDDAHLIQRLQETPPADIERKALFFQETIRGRWDESMARSFHEHYNRGLRSSGRRLPPWGLVNG